MMLRTKDQTQFECRLASEPGQWSLISAPSAQAAAEAFVDDVEKRLRQWTIASGQQTAVVVVRTLDQTLVQACYRVRGQMTYGASLMVPGRETADG